MSKFTLPNGLIHEGKLYDTVELDEIRGKHQNMLVNPNPKTPIDFIEPILSDLILDLHNSDSESIFPAISRKELVLHKLPIQDIQFMLVKVREVSYGKDYLMSLKCPHCEHNNNAKLDLASLEVVPRQDKINEAQMILPKEGKEFRYKALTLANSVKVFDTLVNLDKKTDLITSSRSYMIESLGDNKDVTPKDLAELRGSDLNYR